MRYEIKIENSSEPSGTIDLQRLALLAESMLKISEGALQIRIRGISLTKGRKRSSLKEALRISLSKIKQGSTVLCLESEKFKHTLGPFQMDMFRQEAQRDLQEQTPVSLFINTFQHVFEAGKGYKFLDIPLLKELKKFNKAFLNDQEVMVFSNQNSIPQLKIKKDDFNKITELEEELPDPTSIVLNGTVEELKYSKLKVRIQTAEGIVDGFLSGDLSSQDIAACWGKEVNLPGTLHYKPGGKYIVEIKSVFEADSMDDYFSEKPKSETAEQQIQRQITEKGGNRLSKIVGKWPGDEDYEELVRMLTK